MVRVSIRRAEAEIFTIRKSVVYTTIMQATSGSSARALSFYEVHNRTARHERLRSQHMKSTL